MGGIVGGTPTDLTLQTTTVGKVKSVGVPPTIPPIYFLLT